MKGRSAFSSLMFFMGLALLLPSAQAAENQSKEVERLQTSIDVLRAITKIPEKRIPPVLLRRAQAIAIIPSVYKAGFIVGASWGEGEISIKDPNGNWSNPVFITLAGGSVGWQIGAESTDLILVFKNRGVAEKVKHGRFTVGADASVAAGPVGREAEAATNIKLKSEIYSYSQSRGLFAGVSLDGAVLEPNNGANQDYYGVPIDQVESLKHVPAGAREFKEELRKVTGE
jgi:lipid-binding SYLF domain-containing protein